MNWAKASEVRAGDTLIADEGFTCVDPGPVLIEGDENGMLHFRCKEGWHHLNGQTEDGRLIGLSLPEAV